MASFEDKTDKKTQPRLSRRGTVIILVSAAAALLAGIFLLLFLPERDTGAERVISTPVPDNFRYLTENDSLLMSVTFMPPDGEHFTINLSYTTNSYIPAYELEASKAAFPGNQDILRLMVSAARPITRLERVMENADDARLSLFGFDSPALEWELHFEDGSTERIMLGERLPTGEGCYIRAAGSREVLILRQEQSLSVLTPLEDLFDIIFLPIPPSTEEEQTWVYIIEARLEKPGGDVIHIHKRDFAAIPEVTLSMSAFYLSEPFHVECNDYVIQTVFMEPITYIQPSLVVEANPADLSVYGLDGPAALTVSLPLTEEENYARTLLIGSHDSALGGRYVMIEGHNAVLLDTGGNYGFLDAVANQLRSRFIWLHQIADVESVEFYLDGEIRALRLEHDGGGGLEGFLDGKPLGEDNTRRLYTAALSIMSDGSTDAVIPPGAGPVYAITMHFAGGGSETVELYPLLDDGGAISDSRYLISHNGINTGAYITRLVLLRNLISRFETLDAGNDLGR